VKAREVCFLIGHDDTVLWSDASDSPVALPDTRERWEAIWSRRDAIVEIAHTHPLGGAAFSIEDETTMVALDSALGRNLTYSVVTPQKMIRRIHSTEAFTDSTVEAEPWWTALIRVASGVFQPQPRDDEEE
jgi:hypothetical protein